MVTPPAIVEEALVINPWKTGWLEKTRAPVPVSSVIRAASLAEVSMEVEEILLLKIVQSVDESLPLLVELANGRLKVWMFESDVMVKSVPAVPVANVWVAPVWPVEYVPARDVMAEDR